MEFLDYARLRWKTLLLGLVIGLAAIGVLATGVLSPANRYTAHVKLLIRPPAAQLSVFGFNLDRYIGTEIASLYSDSSLKSEAKGTPLSTAELNAALTTSHSAGTDIVTVSIQADNGDEAISIANHVASVYLKDAQARTGSYNQQSVSYLQDQLAQEQTAVQDANSQLSQARTQALRNGQRNLVADASLLDPEAYSQQQISIAAVQQLQQQLLTLQLASQATGLSRVLNSAETASPSIEPWGVTTIAAAIAGLLLALVALTALALSFSNRVISIARWNRITEGSDLRPAIRGRRRTPRPADARRIARAVANTGVSGPVATEEYPVTTRRTSRAARQIARDLEQMGIDVAGQRSAAPGADDVSENSPPSRRGPIITIVDTSSCRLEDVIIFADGDQSTLRSTVPVLI